MPALLFGRVDVEKILLLDPEQISEIIEFRTKVSVVTDTSKCGEGSTSDKPPPCIVLEDLSNHENRDDKRKQDTVESAGRMHWLSGLLYSNLQEYRVLGLVALRVMARDEEHRAILGLCGAAHTAVRILADSLRLSGALRPSGSGSDAGSDSAVAAVTHAAGLLCNLAIYEPNRDVIRVAGGLDPLAAVLSTRVAPAVELAVGCLRNLAAKNEANQRAMLSGGIVQRLVACLGASNEVATQSNAVWALYNLLSNKSSEMMEAVGSPSAIELLGLLLSSPYLEVVKGALHVLDVLASKAAFAKAICRAGARASLVSLASSFVHEAGVTSRCQSVLRKLPSPLFSRRSTRRY
mmetsp:Transcript_4965/g.8519  ORF Transcript_4965/g.8519 Transcript_4965/m.8519 type:complete len:350 (-) Transcript_4965:7-1056(-)